MYTRMSKYALLHLGLKLCVILHVLSRVYVHQSNVCESVNLFEIVHVNVFKHVLSCVAMCIYLIKSVSLLIFLMS